MKAQPFGNLLMIRTNSTFRTDLLLLVLALVSVLAACRVLDLGPPPTPTPPSEIDAIVQAWSDLTGALPSPKQNTIVEVWNSLAQQFVEKDAIDLDALRQGAIDAMMKVAEESDEGPDPDRLREAAIVGMLKVLDDPYTTYLKPSEYDIFIEDIQGKFEGIGASVGFQDGRITILTPLPGTPAEQEGIRAGDVILEVDGRSTEGWTVLEAVIKIRGPKGTPVNLLVQHVDDVTPTTIKIVRGVIQIESLHWEMLPNGLVHIQVREFADNTDEALTKALEEIQELEVQGIVLDLRDNSGGLLSTTVNIASQFLKEGLVFYLLDSDGKRTDYRVKSGGLALDIPMAALVNQFSASASEVLAGALQDHDRAILIGTTTFGKGSANVPQPLSDGAGLYVTIGRWYSPSGRLIEGKGLE
ncbi:MAG: S41 family peptidase, partial [Chloroflexi bacterium]|nr:S41 family peptidase [Chloroflexota bacterium]